MRLCVKEGTGEEGKAAYKNAFGDGFRENKDSKTPEGYMWIKTVARPSKIEFVHENLSCDNRDQEKGLGDKSWSKDGYRLVWNRYAKRFLKVCSSEKDLKLFANKIAIAANNVSSKNEKWVDLTVFNSLGDSELKTAFIKELLAYGINVLAYENDLPLEFLSSAAEIYQYETKRVRYLEGAPVSKEVLQSKTEECEAQRKNLLTGIREAKNEYSVPENVLYLCSVEDIIREADKNTNLSRLTLPWKGQEDFNSLHPLEGNLAAALGKIASVKSEREWTVVLEGMASEGKVSRELQESIYQAVDWEKARRRYCYNPVAGTISVVKKDSFSQVWRNAMEACIRANTWVDIYKHDLDVPGFDFIAAAAAPEFRDSQRGYSIQSGGIYQIDIEKIAKIFADYVLGKKGKIRENMTSVQLTVYDNETTPGILENAVKKHRKNSPKKCRS